jgi:hypothetical protein
VAAVWTGLGGALTTVPTFGTLTSYAVPLTASFATDDPAQALDVVPAAAVGTAGTLDLGTYLSGNQPGPEDVLTIRFRDPALPLTFRVEGDLGRVVQGLHLAPDGRTVVADFGLIPVVHQTERLTGQLVVVAGNAWATASFEASVTLEAPPILASAAGTTGSLAGSVSGTVAGSVYEAAYGGSGGEVSVELQVPVRGIVDAPVYLTGLGPGSGDGWYRLHGEVAGVLTGAGSFPAGQPASVPVQGPVSGTVTGAVYDPSTGRTTYLLTGTVQGIGSGSVGWIPGSGTPGPFAGTFAGTVSGSVYAVGAGGTPGS